jgi:hypothetical protein
MPIMFFKRRFLLFPACKNILRRPFIFFAFLCSYKETLAKKNAKGQTDKILLCKILYVFPFGIPFRIVRTFSRYAVGEACSEPPKLISFASGNPTRSRRSVFSALI